jgi:hypothetical protein
MTRETIESNAENMLAALKLVEPHIAAYASRPDLDTHENYWADLALSACRNAIALASE